jgi:hypothetical protein
LHHLEISSSGTISGTTGIRLENTQLIFKFYQIIISPLFFIGITWFDPGLWVASGYSGHSNSAGAGTSPH